MFIDPSSFPIVRMDFNAVQEGEPSFADFTALLDRGTPFVVIAAPGEGSHDDHDHDPKQRKQMVLWMKANRARIIRLVKAMVYVEPNLAKRLALRASSPFFQKFWGYPMMVARSDEHALEVAGKLLEGQSVEVGD